MLAIMQLHKTFAQRAVLKDIDLDVPTGEILCLLGPSGCGKTTLLRCIAGLETHDQGDIAVDGKSLATTPPYQRGFGLMFQDHALFPHMTVAQNIAFGLRMNHVDPKQQQRRIQEMLTLVNLQGADARDVTTLSGGERQRVALARSLAPNPRLLMLDEPLGSLDAILRDRLVLDVRDIIKQVGLTAVYVTHDRLEAFAIADRIAVMNDGQIEQIATPAEVYHHPATTFVAQFMGLNNLYPPAHIAPLLEKIGIAPPKLNSLHTILIHPDGITVNTGTAIGGHLNMVLATTRFQGSTTRLEGVLENGHLISFSAPFQTTTYLHAGDTIQIALAPHAVLALPA